MLEKYIPKRFATAMIKHVIAVTLFFPYFYSHNGIPYYQDFVLANFFTILAMVFICTSWKLDFRRNAVLVSALSILLVAYNIFSTYMNVKYHHWYGEQINTTIAFLFFIVLLLVKDSHALIDSSTIKATIHMIVASNLIAVCVRMFTEYNQIRFINNRIEIIDYALVPCSDTQFAWLYGHKSEYGLVIVACISFLAVNKNFLRNTYSYILSQGLLLLCLLKSDIYTPLVAAAIILIGQFLDYLLKSKWWKKLVTLLAILPIAILLSRELLLRINTNRNLLTLGYRTHIWKQFFSYIKEQPNGMLLDSFGVAKFTVENTDLFTNNAHNVFLNYMFRFSIPVGIIYTLLFIVVITFAIKKKLCITTICILTAIIIPLNMDYSLLPYNSTYLILILFILFFSNAPVHNEGKMISSSIEEY